MRDVTRLLQASAGGDAQAADDVLSVVYQELHRMARARMAQEAPGATLQATALVNEAYLRLVGESAPEWNSRGHFFSAAAEAMRRILIDKAREKGAIKRGGGRTRESLDAVQLAVDAPPSDLLDLDEALRRLAEEDPKVAELVKVRFYVGLTLAEAAETLGIAPSTADRYWAYARAWLYHELTRGCEPDLPR